MLKRYKIQKVRNRWCTLDHHSEYIYLLWQRHSWKWFVLNILLCGLPSMIVIASSLENGEPVFDNLFYKYQGLYQSSEDAIEAKIKLDREREKEEKIEEFYLD